MPLEQKVLLLVGGELVSSPSYTQTPVLDRNVPGACGRTHALAQFGIPSVLMADGPAGVRIQPSREGTDSTFYGTAFPIATALSSTWNPGLVYEVGCSMGEEAREYGLDMLLAPALNIQRNPLCGRNFEYYSEDPLVSGKMAAAMVAGIQSQGVGACIKHFAVNNQETNRVANQPVLSRRALYEIYLRGFELAVREASPWAVMTSYNYVNGQYASESPDLVNSLLRGVWGFDGLVMTDWFGGNDAVLQMKAGNDLLMPGRSVQYEQIMSAIRSGALSEKVIDENLAHMLKMVMKTGSFSNRAFSDTPDMAAHAAVSLQASKESVVLLKNESASLPLKKGSRLALFGNTSYDFISGGTGSGDVNEEYTVSLEQGMRNHRLRVDRALARRYKSYLAEESAKIVVDYEANPLYDFLAHPRIEELQLSGRQIRRYARRNAAAVITIGRNSGEHADRVVEDDFNLKESELSTLRYICETFHARKKPVIVILNIAGVVETASWKELPDAIVLAWHGGQESGNAVASVLCGETNPSGHLSMTFANDYFDYPGALDFPYDHGANVPEILNNVLNVRGLKYDRKNIDFTEYSEEIFVGYRGLVGEPAKVSFPFGFGLSYTDFSFSGFNVERTSDGIMTFTTDVTNTGNRAGKEVAQVYVTRPCIGRPMRELVAFAKTGELQPGCSEKLELTVTEDMLAVYEDSVNSLILHDGKYVFSIGRSCADMADTLSYSIEKAKVIAVLPELFK